MAAGWAHLLEMRTKLRLDPAQYLVVHQIYRGWALLGIVIFAALISTTALAVFGREPVLRRSAGVAAACIALSLGIFFAYTYPVNQLTANWTKLPADWAALRLRWEWSHATNAVIYFAALASLTLGLVKSRVSRAR
jgi:hypothetical protein